MDLQASYRLSDIPEYKVFQAENPQNEIDAEQCAIMFGRAIHWLSFMELLWPPFETENYYMVFVSYLIANDPSRKEISQSFYQEIALMMKHLWTIKLDSLYPNGDWKVNILGWDGEITVEGWVYREEC